MTEISSRPIRRALLSVSDKTGIVEFGRFLAERGIEILSTGGTAEALLQAGIAVRDVAAYTGFPEILDGRVKTLHPRIHGGILARRDRPDHRDEIARHDIGPIDLVVVSLYPFERTLAAGADFATIVENIDIGGIALLRAAAKNHADVAVIAEPQDYAPVMAAMIAGDSDIGADLRRRLAAKAFARTAAYDSAIATWLNAAAGGETWPERLNLTALRRQVLRYGENPHQQGAFYALPGAGAEHGLAAARQIQGKELSYNNLNDADAAWDLVNEFDDPAIVIVKHANPCGVALAAAGERDLAGAYRRALSSDPQSAFGGILAVNRPLDAALAAAIGDLFLEVVIAPQIPADVAALFAAKKNLRLLETGGRLERAAKSWHLRSLGDGLLVQDRDAVDLDPAALRIVTRRAPSAEEMRDLLFAFRVAKHVKSNAIVYARQGATVGIGAGQMSRVDSSRIAAWKAQAAASAAGESESWAKNSVVASDAFFPFADGLMAAAEAGATAIIQPGGSLRDAEVIAAADASGLAMVFTGIRHFRH